MENVGKSGEWRYLQPDDLERVVEIDAAITGRQRRQFFVRRLEAALGDNSHFVAAATEKDGRLTGFAIARVQEGEFGATHRAGVLDGIGVDPAFMGQGYGHALLDGLCQQLEKRQAATLRTQVAWSDHDLMHFFAGRGFDLASIRILECDTSGMIEGELDIPEQEMDAGMMDFSDPGRDDATALSRDKVLVRSMSRDDLEHMIRIDTRLTGRNRAAYFNDKWLEITGSAGVRVSLVAEMDGLMAGFVMARVDYGEYGRAESVAVMDTIGVDEGFAHQGVGHALMSQLMFNLKGLQVETLRTNVSWGQFALMRFLDDTGFAPAQRLSLVLPLS